MKELTLLELLAERSTHASKNARKLRDECATLKEANDVDMKSYRMGESVAYDHAAKLVKSELERLRNLWQNNALTFDSFNTY